MAGIMGERGRAEQQEDQDRPHLLRAPRQRDRDKSRGAHHNRASIGRGEALEHFQNQKKLLSKHGRKTSLRINERRREAKYDRFAASVISAGRLSNQQPFTESPRPSLVNASQ
jgi:hypothetical protein